MQPGGADLEIVAPTLKSFGSHPSAAIVRKLVQDASTQQRERFGLELLAAASGKQTKAEVLGHDELTTVWRPTPEHEETYGCGE